MYNALSHFPKRDSPTQVHFRYFRVRVLGPFSPGICMRDGGCGARLMLACVELGVRFILPLQCSLTMRSATP